MFSCEFYEIYKNTFLQSTSEWLLLFIVYFELLSHLFLVFSLLNLSMFHALSLCLFAWMLKVISKDWLTDWLNENLYLTSNKVSTCKIRLFCSNSFTHVVLVSALMIMKMVFLLLVTSSALNRYFYIISIYHKILIKFFRW